MRVLVHVSGVGTKQMTFGEFRKWSSQTTVPYKVWTVGAAQQPREQPVPCYFKCGAQTWNTSSACDECVPSPSMTTQEAVAGLSTGPSPLGPPVSSSECSADTEASRLAVPPLRSVECSPSGADL